MADYRILPCSAVEPADLSAFLYAAYADKPEKAAFLVQHGEWLYHGNENHFVVVDDTGSILGYCAVIPTHMCIAGCPEAAVWWVDLIVLPAYRGLGLQTRLDELIRNMPQHKLGYPNELAAKIHKKHGWGVTQSGQYMRLSLRPMRLKQNLFQQGLAGQLVRFKKLLTDAPQAARIRRKFAGYQTQQVQMLENPDAEILAGIFARHNMAEKVITTYRDAAYIQWRYLQAPCRDQLRFYITDSMNLVLITREAYRGTELRILDVWGDFTDSGGLQALIRSAVRDAVRRDAWQVWVLAAHPYLVNALSEIGFAADLPRLFCWYTNDPAQMPLLDGTYHWSLADSDNDTVG